MHYPLHHRYMRLRSQAQVSHLLDCRPIEAAPLQQFVEGSVLRSSPTDSEEAGPMRLRHRRYLIPIVPVLFLGALVLSVVQAWADTAAYYRPFQWRAPEGGDTLQGLYLYDLAPNGIVSRVLAETPGKRPVLITEILDPQRGLMTTELVDVGSGWRASFEVDLGVRRADVQALFDAWKQLGNEHSYKARLALLDGLSTRFELPSDGSGARFHEAFSQRVSAESRSEEIASAIPEELKPSLLFLDASLSPNPNSTGVRSDNFAYSLRGVVEILAGALRDAEPDRNDLHAHRWLMEVASHTKGLVLQDPKLSEFVAQFPGLDVIEPLADRRAADLSAARTRVP